MNKRSKTPMWWILFALEYLRNGENASAAYRKAKPNVSEKTAGVEASRLLGDSRFAKVLEEERLKLIKELDMSREEWLKEIVWVAKCRPEKVEAAGKLKALELLGKVKKFVGSEGSEVKVDLIAMIARVRADPNSPRLTSEDIDRILECEIVDDP